METRFVLRFGALGFVVSVLMFFALVVIVSPFNFADPVYEILTNQVNTTTDTFDQYMKILPAYYVIDNILIVGWIIGWVGITILVGKRSQTLGIIVLVLGLAGPVLDFLENEISWTLISVYQSTASVPTNWYVGWRVTRQMSYILPYSVATLVGIGLWSRQTLDRVVTGVGTIGVAIALMGMYMPAWWLGAQLWWPVWFVCLGLSLWQRNRDFLPEETIGGI